MSRTGIAALGLLALVAPACSKASTPARPVAKAGEIVTVLGAKRFGGGTRAARGYELVAVDGQGALFAASEFGPPLVIRVPAKGAATTVVDCTVPFPSGPSAKPIRNPACDAPEAFDKIGGLAVDRAGTVYASDVGHYRIRAVTASGERREVAGTGNPGSAGPLHGPAKATSFQVPGALAVDRSGDVYFVNGATVVKVGTDGTLNTVAGTGENGFSGDGGPATQARLEQGVAALAVDGAGNLYIASGARVRRVDPAGVITTVAGTGTFGFIVDNGPATAAQFNRIQGLAVDGAGDLFIADFENNRIREVTPAGRVSTIAGTGSAAFTGDGGPASQASVNHPVGLAVDGVGNLYVAVVGSNRVRMIGKAGRG